MHPKRNGGRIFSLCTILLWKEGFQNLTVRRHIEGKTDIEEQSITYITV